MDVVDLAALGLLVLNHHPHCRGLRLRVRPHAADVKGLAFWVWQDKDTGYSLNSL